MESKLHSYNQEILDLLKKKNICDSGKQSQYLAREFIESNKQISPNTEELILYLPFFTDKFFKEEFKEDVEKDLGGPLDVKIIYEGDMILDRFVEGIIKLNNDRGIHSLTIYDAEIYLDRFDMLLKSFKNLTKLAFITVVFDQRHYQLLNHYLPSYKKLESLTLCNNQPQESLKLKSDICEDKMDDLKVNFSKNFKYEFIQQLSSLKELSLSGNSLDLDNLNQVLMSLKDQLIHLNLEKCSFAGLDSKIKEFTLTHMTKLKAVSLSGAIQLKLHFIKENFFPKNIEFLNLNLTKLDDIELDTIMKGNSFDRLRKFYANNNVIRLAKWKKNAQESKSKFQKFMNKAYAYKESDQEEKKINDNQRQEPIENNHSNNDSQNGGSHDMEETKLELDLSSNLIQGEQLQKFLSSDKKKSIKTFDCSLQANPESIVDNNSVQVDQIINESTSQLREKMEKIHDEIEKVVQKGVDENIIKLEDNDSKRERVESIKYLVKALLYIYSQFAQNRFVNYSALLSQSNLHKFESSFKTIEQLQGFPIYRVPLRQAIPPANQNQASVKKKGLIKQKDILKKLLIEILGFNVEEVTIDDLPEESELNALHRDDSIQLICRCLLPAHNITHDFEAAQFSIIYYPDSDVFNLEFAMSNDFFLDRDDRVQTLSISNHDLLLDLTSYLNERQDEFIFTLGPDLTEEGKYSFSTLTFRKNFMKFGDVDTCQQLIESIDLGFLILELLKSEDLFDSDWPVANYERMRKKFGDAIEDIIEKFYQDDDLEDD